MQFFWSDNTQFHGGWAIPQVSAYQFLKAFGFHTIASPSSATNYLPNSMCHSATITPSVQEKRTRISESKVWLSAGQSSEELINSPKRGSLSDQQLWDWWNSR
jgi:hypothetical protein